MTVPSRIRSAKVPNAWLDDGLTLRVGVPHFNGSLPAHCSEEQIPVMVSAGAFWQPRRGEFAKPSRYGWSTDGCNVALDSAGFVAMRHWASQGPQAGMAGVYPWSLDQYVDLVSEVMPRWWSQPDACCEPEIAGDENTVLERLAVTRRLLEQSLLRSCMLLTQHPSLRHFFRPPVPVIQGWRADHYRRSLDGALRSWDLFTTGTCVERTPTLIGIGSVCRRDLRHREHGLWAVLDAIGRDIPADTKVHLFGVKGEAMANLRHYPFVCSVDSMAWDFTARVEARKAGRSNTMAHRIGHLEFWRTRQLARAQQGAADLFTA